MSCPGRVGKGATQSQPPGGGPAGVRLDVFLDVACLFPTRSQAGAACTAGKVDLNGHAASPHKIVRPGDELKITFTAGKRSFLVNGVAERHVVRALARTLYTETTPPLSPQELEARRLERQLAPRRDEGRGKLSRKERRERERLFQDSGDR